MLSSKCLLQKSQGHAAFPTIMGWLGHPLSFQQTTMKKPLKPPQQVALLTRMHFDYIEKCVVWAGSKDSMRKGSKKEKKRYGKGEPTVVIRLHFRRRIPVF